MGDPKARTKYARSITHNDGLPDLAVPHHEAAIALVAEQADEIAPELAADVYHAFAETLRELGRDEEAQAADEEGARWARSGGELAAKDDL